MSNEGEVVVENEIPVQESQVTDEQVASQDAETSEESTEKPAEPAIPKGVQKRIDRAVRQKYEAEARAKMLEERLAALEQAQRQPQQTQKVIDNSEPKIENFDDFDSFVAAKAEWIAAKKIEETLTARERKQLEEREATERQKTVESWSRRVAEATAEMPDFEDVIASSDVPMTAPMQQAIMESDVGPKLAYYLATNPDEAVEISRMSSIGQVRALGRIEAKLESGTAGKKVTSAPPPVKTVGGRSTVKVDPDKMSTDEWLKWRQEQLKKRA